MGRVRRGEIQYKETEVFELFPVLEYDKMQKRRLILFHAYARDVRRIINYAAHFDKPNCLCMVYIVGEVAPEKIQKLLAGAECSNRVCVLTSPFPADDMAFCREFDERRDALIKSGDWDAERQTVTAEWLHIRDVEIWWKAQLDAATPDLDGQLGFGDFGFSEASVPELWRTHNAKLVAQQAETLDMIRRYHALARKAPSYFRRWTLHRRGLPPAPFRHAGTGKLVAKIYPYGAEARGVNAYAGLSPASVESAVKLVTDGAENWRLGFDRAFVADFKPVREIRKFVEDAFDAQGYCTLSALAEFVKSPPFGLSNDGYSAAILCAALCDLPDALFFDSLTDSPLREEMLYFCRKTLPPEDGRPAYKRAGRECCLYREYPCHALVRDALEELYGLADYAGRYVVTYARAKMETLFRLPISMTDDLLFSLTSPEILWHDRAQMEGLAAEVAARRDELPRVLAEHIARDKRIPYRGGIPSAAGWLWDKETMLDAPHCMMTRAERDKRYALLERRRDCEKREEIAASREERRSASDDGIKAAREENAYTKSLAEPCKRRLLELCASGL